MNDAIQDGESEIQPVSRYVYISIFNEYNIGFKKPKKDICLSFATFDNLEQPSEEDKEQYKKNMVKQGANNG